MKRILLTVALVLVLHSVAKGQFSSRNYSRPIVRSTPNIFGGENFYFRGGQIRSVPNSFHGFYYSHGWSTRRNIFGGNTHYRRY